MKDVLERMVALRRKVSPRSSYATSGAVASTFVVVGADEDVTLEWGDGLLHTGEFDNYDYVAGVMDAPRADKHVRSHVVVFVNPTLDEMDLAGRLVDQRKTNLVFIVLAGEGKEGSVAGARALASGARQVVVDEFPPQTWLTTVCVNRGSSSGSSGSSGSSSSSSSGSGGNGSSSGQTALGFNQQPSVQSRQQFRYLWDAAAKAATSPTAASQRGIYAAHMHGPPALAPAMDAKLRVLQRLADKELHDKSKWSADVWDNHISTALGVGFDDYGIYNSLREKFTGTSLDAALRLDSRDAVEALEEGEEGPEPEVPAVAGPVPLAGAGAMGGDEGADSNNPDGRAQYMVDMTVECLPEALARPGQVSESVAPCLPPAAARPLSHHPPTHSSTCMLPLPHIPHSCHARQVRSLLDYGCAEGAITEHLRRRLQVRHPSPSPGSISIPSHVSSPHSSQITHACPPPPAPPLLPPPREQVPPERAYGADVRALHPQGFTFVLLPAEGPAAPTEPLLPMIPDASVDLVTAAMVFHHVTHVAAALEEIRRVISPQVTGRHPSVCSDWPMSGISTGPALSLSLSC